MNQPTKKILDRKNKKILVGMSGGIDSSMAALLLKKQGWNPIGISLDLPLWQGKSFDKTQDKRYKNAKKVCQKLKIPHQIINLKKDFEKKVVDYFNNELKNNQTPNPCVFCNRHLKFSQLISLAKKQGINYVATGHYARIKRVLDYPPAKAQHVRAGKSTRVLEYKLLKAKDKGKDQTYNLCFLTQNQLKQIVFPLGNQTKKQTYQLAKKQGFSFLTKQKESQDFCYLAQTTLSQYLNQTFKPKPGEIINEKKEIIGKHQGLYFYTIGQRKKIGLSGGPYFVKEKDSQNNQLIVTKNEKDLFQKEIILSPFNFISNQPPKKPIQIRAKIRYQHPESQAILYPVSSTKKESIKTHL